MLKSLVYLCGLFHQILSSFKIPGTSLVVQWLRLHAPNAGGLGLIPGQETRFHMPQLKYPVRGNEDPAQPNK